MPTHGGAGLPGSNSISAGEQIEFDFAECARNPLAAEGLPIALARAMTPPGWWSTIGLLWGTMADEVVVESCYDDDGVLQISAYSADMEELEGLLSGIRLRISNTCGACGILGGERTRYSFNEPARVVCKRCRDRLLRGESFVKLTDEFWTLAGERRRVDPSATRYGTAATPSALSADKTCGVLPPDELRALIRRLREAMLEHVIGQEEACGALALNAALLVGGGLARGPRLLVVGPTGTGKTTALTTLRECLALEGYRVPWVMAAATDISSPPWGGDPSIGDLILTALGSHEPDSVAGRHMVVAIDEFDKAGVVKERNVTSNSRQMLEERLASLLQLFNGGGGPIPLADTGKVWSSQHAMVVGMGAFGGMIDPPEEVSVGALVRAGFPVELSSRMETVVRLRPLAEEALRTLLRRWPSVTSLTATCERLGYTVRIHDEVYTRAARAVVDGSDGATPRTGGSWIVTALRAALSRALLDDEQTTIELAPDSLSIPRTPEHASDDGTDGHDVYGMPT